MGLKNFQILLLALLIPLLLNASESFTAEVYKQDTDPPLLLYYQYNEHEIQGETEVLSHYYLLPDSSEAVTEKAVLKDGKLWKYNANFYVTDELSEILLDDQQLSITYTDRGKTKSKTFSFDDNLLVGPLFVEFLVSKWNELISGETVKFRLPATDLLTTAGFFLKKVENSKYEKPGTIVIKMGVSSIFLKLLIKSSYFVMDVETKRVKEIHGLSILPHLDNGEWKKTTKVNIFYDYK